MSNTDAVKVKAFGGLCSILILAGMFLVPESIGLSRQGIHAMGILIAIIVALVTDCLPIGVTCFLGIAFLVIFGVAENISQALVGYTNHILFFVLVSFGISEAIAKVPLSKRLLVLLIKVFGAKSKNILLALMLCAALMSSIMSNVATTAVLIAVVVDFLKIYEDPQVNQRSGKAFMIGLPIASMIGGMMTPAGSPLNMLGMDFLVKEAGIRVTFVQWMVIGVPIALVSLVFAWLLIAKVFAPGEIPSEKIDFYLDSLDIPDKFDFREKYVTLIVCAMFILWIMSSWFPVLNITVVGMVGFAFLFVPGIEILTWRNYCDSVSWASFFLIGTMMSIGSMLSLHGVSGWLVNLFFSDDMHLPIRLMVLVFCLVVFLLLLPIPIGPALISMLGSPFILLATTWGVSPVLLIMPLVICAACCFLLPLDTVPLLTYATGYYKMMDMPKVSIAIQLVIALCVTLWLPIALNILHII